MKGLSPHFFVYLPMVHGPGALEQNDINRSGEGTVAGKFKKKKKCVFSLALILPL